MGSFMISFSLRDLRTENVGRIWEFFRAYRTTSRGNPLNFLDTNINFISSCSFIFSSWSNAILRGWNCDENTKLALVRRENVTKYISRVTESLRLQIRRGSQWVPHQLLAFPVGDHQPALGQVPASCEGISVWPPDLHEAGRQVCCCSLLPSSWGGPTQD